MSLPKDVMAKLIKPLAAIKSTPMELVLQKLNVEIRGSFKSKKLKKMLLVLSKETLHLTLKTGAILLRLTRDLNCLR